MQEPSRQLPWHFTGRLAQAVRWELRPEFTIANLGLVRSGDCLGNAFRTRAGDQTSPKRKRGSGLTSLTLRARGKLFGGKLWPGTHVWGSPS
jgi:hypothetical protein